jgi:hypothetical protein
MHTSDQGSLGDGEQPAQVLQVPGASPQPSSQPPVQQYQITLDQVLQTHSAKSFDYRVSARRLKAMLMASTDSLLACRVTGQSTGQGIIH